MHNGFVDGFATIKPDLVLTPSVQLLWKGRVSAAEKARQGRFRRLGG